MRNDNLDLPRQEMLKTLGGLIGIPSVRGQAEEAAPFGREIGDSLDYVLQVCREKGFRTKNESGYYGICEYGSGEDLIAVLVHLDVVPAGEGWSHEPYGLSIDDGKLYGRGVIDDKGPAVACIYALEQVARTMEAEGVQPNKRVRLIFGTDEETSWEDMTRYRLREEMPCGGFTADADFPVVFAEKGILTFQLVMPNRETRLSEIEGGTVTNAVPASCRILYDGNVSEVMGKGAHACEPEKGKNAIATALQKLDRMGIESPLVDFWKTHLGDEPDGRLLGCDFKDDASGRLTMNMGTICMDEKEIRLGIDIRYPVSRTCEEVLAAVEAGLEGTEAHVEKVAHRDPLYLPEDSENIRILTECFARCTGQQMKPISTGGGTYARALTNIAAFGPVFPWRECTEHQADEYMYEDDFYQITEVYYHALLQLMRQ